MGLCLKLCFVFALLFPSVELPSMPSPAKASPSFKTADLCELLRDAHVYEHEELLNEYPNEYYDCHAHGRFDKLSTNSEKRNSKPS